MATEDARITTKIKIVAATQATDPRTIDADITEGEECIQLDSDGLNCRLCSQ